MLIAIAIILISIYLNTFLSKCIIVGTITLNVKDKTEEKFRMATELKFGKGKGILGKAASIALEQWADMQTKGNEAKMLELLQKGFQMGKLNYKARAELHER